MAEVSLDRQFIGQARLVRLLLWRIGDSTDVEACLSVAHDAGMLTDDDITFLRSCMDIEERARGAGAITLDIDRDVVVRLRRCADKLNRADSA